jgi:hypothetical protein
MVLRVTPTTMGMLTEISGDRIICEEILATQITGLNIRFYMFFVFFFFFCVQQLKLDNESFIVSIIAKGFARIPSNKAKMAQECSQNHEGEC